MTRSLDPGRGGHDAPERRGRARAARLGRGASFGLALLALAACAPALAAGGSGEPARGQPTLPRAEAEIRTPAAVHRFLVEIADDEEERRLGLMFRPPLGPREGMLFLFPHEEALSFWMKNTPEPLDILFIDAGGRIVHIAADAEPFSLRPIPSRSPAASVLEIRAGTARALGLALGDAVLLTDGPSVP